MDHETASYTTKASIEPITIPFDHSEITITVDFDKVERGPGFWIQQFPPRKQHIQRNDKNRTNAHSL